MQNIHCRIFGYSREELLNRSFFDFVVSPDAQDESRQHHLSLFENKPLELQPETLESITKDGGSIWIRRISDFVWHDGYPKYLVSMNVDVTKQQEAEEALAEERESLKKKNIALREILSHIEEEKTTIKNSVVDKVNQVLIPALKKLIKSSDGVDKMWSSFLMKSLQNLSKLSFDPSEVVLAQLSPREIQVCNLIKAGASSKEIAQTLDLSLSTVNKHRERIKGKLNIANRGVALSLFLKSVDKQ